MQLITVATTTAAAQLGVSPEKLTQWLWEEFHRQDETLQEGEWDRVEFPSTEPTPWWTSEWGHSDRSWKRHRRNQYRG